jgi:soluble lytic murein transglycosylase-like protein
MEQSIARQKVSVQRQTFGASSDGFFTTGWMGKPLITLAPPSSADCGALNPKESEALVSTAANAQKLDPGVLRAVIQQESGFQPCAVSPKGAMGLMQLMPDTAGHFHVADPFNAEQNLAAGATYLKQLLDRFHGDLKLALAAYNAGPERVDGDPPSVPDIPETQDYVMQILKSLEKAK